MIDTKDFNFNNLEAQFDFKGFLYKVFGYWKWFLISLIICFIIAFQVNIRKEKIYQLETSITLKEKNNPFFTSNTSLVFNWGGTSDQVSNLVSEIKSRTQNEKIVKKLQYYINYQKKDKYYDKDVYGDCPFKVELNKNNFQILDTKLNIKIINQQEFQLSVDFESLEQDDISLYNYETNINKSIPNPKSLLKKNFKFGETIKYSFLNFKLTPVNINDLNLYKNKEFNISFSNFDQTVASYREIKATIDKEAGSIIKISLTGKNKNRLVEYLNTLSQELIILDLDRKNRFATNTIAFIDSSLVAMERDLKISENDLKNFNSQNNVITISEGGTQISTQLLDYETEKDLLSRKIAYYNNLQNYIINNNDFSKLPAPSVVGIEDPNIVNNVTNLINMSKERSDNNYLVKNSKFYQDQDSQASSYKKVLLENIKSAKQNLNQDLSFFNSKLNVVQSKMRALPLEQQELMKITNKYDLKTNIITTFLAKKSEAQIVRAANLSDIQIIDNAKDIGGGQIGPNTSINNILALIIGLLIPFLIILVKFILDTNILNTEDISNLTKIPIIGIVGVKNTDSNLSVFEKPKSPLSESFRTIRSSLQFIYKNQMSEGCKTLMITSSVGGEGKTFCTINLATIFALSDKKTVIVGMDLRKPKIFEDFNHNNNIGVTNYLINQNNLNEIVKSTQIPNLDFISSGPIPPNPSELIINERMNELIIELKNKYDYIILDTPPVGLVSDALELSNFADITLYVIRQNFTKKDMVKLLNTRKERGELKNISIILNGFQNNAKYGYSYGYGYGYGNYGEGYLEKENTSIFQKIKSILKKYKND
jgi:succinoglycan biosynthesis transport protein ExoP